MSAATKDRNTEIKIDPGLKSFPVKGITKIYKGTLVGINSSGLAIPAADVAGVKVVGVADAQADNSAGADSAISVNVRAGLARLVATSITQAMVGKAMYVVDDQTFDDTKGTNGVLAGILAEYVGSTDGWLLVGLDVGGALAAAVEGVAGGYKIARGQHTTVAASDTKVTGLATVVAAVVVLDDDPVAGAQDVSCSIGDQAGAPAAGSILIKTWKATAAGDTALIPATTFSKKVNWIAIGI